MVRRFLAVFFPSAEFMVTTRISKVLNHHFKTEGKVLVKPGWMAVYGKEAAEDVEGAKEGDKGQNLVPVREGGTLVRAGHTEAAVDLIPFASKVILAVRSERIKGDPQTLEAVKASDKVEIRYNVTPKEILGDAFVSGMRYADTVTGEEKEVSAGGVFVEIGTVPNSDMVKGLVELDERGEIKTDPRTGRSSVLGIWAAGDVTDALYKQNNIAVGDGVRALLNAYEWLKNGKIEQAGSPEDIYQRPATRFVAEFIGSPAMNFIEAKRDALGVSAQGQQLGLSTRQRSALLEGSGDAVHYGIRPEEVNFAADGLPGELSMIEPTGPETYVSVDTAVGTITARVPGNLRAHVGDRVHLRWDPEKSHLFAAQSQRRIG